ncbi:MAG: hypothetical protein WEA31_02290 [Pirellulales bacterium]
MTYRFKCPNGHVLKAEPHMAGMRMRCPRCQVAVEVPLRPEDTGESSERPPGVRSTFAVPKRRPGAPPAGQRQEVSKRPEAPKPAGAEIRRKSPPPLPRKQDAGDRWRDEARPGELPAPVPAPSKEPVPPRPTQQAPPAIVPQRPDATRRSEEPPIEAPPLVGDAASLVESPPKRRGYVADQERRFTVYWLGLALFLVAVIGFLPARGHFALGSAPSWAVMVWFVTALQVAYIIYMVSIPDWSTTWIAMLVFAGIAAMYGFMLAVAIWTVGSEELRFGLEPVRANVARWCGGMLLLSFLAAFTCGRISHMWHKRYRYVG